MELDKAKIRAPSPAIAKMADARSGVFTEGYRGEYYNINIDKLIPFSKQPRKHFDQVALEELAVTIKRHGIRQPLTVIADSVQVGQYEVVSGERRLRAAKIAGLIKVPCIIIHDHKAALEISLIENIQREDLHPVDLAFAYKKLLEENICFSHEEIAKKVGKSRSVVTETILLSELPENIRERLLVENINNRNIFRALFKKSKELDMFVALDEYKKSHNKELHFRQERKISSTNRRKVLLKVIYDNGQIYIDTKSISLLSEEKKRALLQELIEILKVVS